MFIATVSPKLSLYICLFRTATHMHLVELYVVQDPFITTAGRCREVDVDARSLERPRLPNDGSNHNNAKAESSRSFPKVFLLPTFQQAGHTTLKPQNKLTCQTQL